ncbi:MAG: sigma 54-interacting transcriptional regulator [Desulfobacterales bacterium]|jgi:PAS domain S-box-containing protein
MATDRNISDCKEKEEILQLREAHFKILFENVPDAMVIIDAESGKFVEANAKAVKLFGLERKELIGIGPLDISPPFQPDGRASEEMIHEKIQELLSEHPKPFEWVHFHASGRDILCEIRHIKLPIPERKLYCAMAIDITERRRAENELTQYKHIIESINNPVGLVDRGYIYRYVNEPYCQALNKPIREIIGHSVSELFGRNFFETVMEGHYKRCFAGETVDYQTWFEFPEWGRRYMDVHYYPFRETDGRVTAVVTNVHDITEIKQLEMKLKESEERFRAFMDHTPASVYIKDENDRHIYGNAEAFRSAAKTADEFIGSTTVELFPPQVADRLIKLDRKVLKGGIPRIVEEWRNTENGDARWRRDIKFPIKLESGKKLLGGIAIDITEIKLSEQKLRNALQEIEKLKHTLEQENIYLREEIDLHHKHEKIIGNSVPVFKMLGLAEQVAETDATVLILGETGTGKELLANEIHRLSKRKDRTMVKVNCAALPATLIESELFGREKGAYTGAMSRQIGRFEIANGSTLFLDEIGELPLELQAKLLRVLQEGKFERLGSPKTIAVDVRIMASTNRDLSRAVSEGRFREDLYYRLNVFSISVPPLRERTEDIPLLLWSFVKELENSMGKTIHRIPQKSLDTLQRYFWPGNIRELKNLVENAMITSKGNSLKIILPSDTAIKVQKPLKLDAVERNHIKDVLKKTSWRVSGKKGAAELLGLKPTTLESRMKKLGIKRPN